MEDEKTNIEKMLEDIEKISAEKERLVKIVQDQFTQKISVMFTDIKGYSTFVDRKGDIAGRLLLQKHNSIVLPIIEENEGVLIKTIGDATMSIYKDPINALKSAIQIQQRLREYNNGKPEEEQIHVRAGLNYGPTLVEEKDVFGGVVDIASRMESLGDADGILVAENLYRAVKNSDEFIFRSTAVQNNLKP